MPSTCTFLLNRNPPVYYSGEVVSGTAILKTTNVKNVKNIYIRLLGEAKVMWEEHHATNQSYGNSSKRATLLRSHVIYINTSTFIPNEGTLSVGTHNYSFNIALPHQCPTSCECSYGNIRYELSLVLKRSYHFDNIYKKPLTVIQTEDLNLNPTHRLNRDPPVYYSGELIAGTVILQTTSEKKFIKNIRLGILGEAKVKWEEQYTVNDSNGNSTRHTTYFRSHRLYVDNGAYVMGEGTLPLGTHKYLFNIALPYECPTSCEGKYGNIRYELSLILNRSFRFDNVYKKALTVIQTVNLNSNPSYKLPVIMEEISSLCCWPCNNGNIFTTLTMPFGAYAPGQHIKYAIRVQNQSMTDVRGHTMEFVQKYTFIATEPKHKERTRKYVLLKQVKSERCLRLTTRIFKGSLQIPSVPPSTFLVDSPVICVDYRLDVSIEISGCHSSVNFKVPVYIGTVPLRESLGTAQETNVVATDEATAPEMTVTPRTDDDLPPRYADFKPPSFEEAIRSESPFVDTDINEHNRIIGFRPLYPMYPSKQ